MATVAYRAIITQDPHPEKNTQLLGLKMEYAQEISKAVKRPEEEFYCFASKVNVLAQDQFNNLIAFIAVGLVEEEKRVYASHVYVMPQFRNQGVYKTMIERLKKFTQDIGYKNITAGVFKNNKVSRKAHQHLGFKPVIDLFELQISKDDEIIAPLMIQEDKE